MTVYALTVALSAAPLTALTARIPRGRLLCLVLLTLMATNVAAALAQSYAALFAARLVDAAAHGVFWSIVSARARFGWRRRAAEDSRWRRSSAVSQWRPSWAFRRPPSSGSTWVGGSRS